MIKKQKFDIPTKKNKNKKTPSFDDDLFTVPLDRYESYFIPGCMERYQGAAQISSGEPDSTSNCGTRTRKRYNL